MQEPLFYRSSKRNTPALSPCSTRGQRRLWAGAEDPSDRAGGVELRGVRSGATGLSRVTVTSGAEGTRSPNYPRRWEGDSAAVAPRGGWTEAPGRSRHGPPAQLGNPGRSSDPGRSMSPLQWTCKSAAKLAAELQASGHAVSERSVNRLLHALGHSSIPKLIAFESSFGFQPEIANKFPLPKSPRRLGRI